jgi:hypothetical protein
MIKAVGASVFLYFEADSFSSEINDNVSGTEMGV